MKGLTLKQYLLSALILMNVLAVHSQNGNGSRYDSPEDSVTCGEHLSAYRTFFNIDLYEYALLTWSQAFNDCPTSSEKMYLDGVTMYRSFIKDAPDGPARESLIDTLMLIYDRRMENFGGEGNIIGRKGKDLLNFSGGDINKVQNAYAMLKKSIELEGNKSRDVIMLSFVSAGVGLNKAEVIDDSQIIEDYMMVVRILDKLEGRSSRWKRTRETIDEIMLKEDMLSCEALDRYYAPKYEENET